MKKRDIQVCQFGTTCAFSHILKTTAFQHLSWSGWHCCLPDYQVKKNKTPPKEGRHYRQPHTSCPTSVSNHGFTHWCNISAMRSGHGGGIKIRSDPIGFISVHQYVVHTGICFPSSSGEQVPQVEIENPVPCLQQHNLLSTGLCTWLKLSNGQRPRSAFFSSSLDSSFVNSEGSAGPGIAKIAFVIALWVKQAN